MLIYRLGAIKDIKQCPYCGHNRCYEVLSAYGSSTFVPTSHKSLFSVAPDNSYIKEQLLIYCKKCNKKIGSKVE